MLENFASLLSEAVLLDRQKPVLIGLSGGADSFCLFHLFRQLNYNLVVAHFDHSLRPNSAHDAELVEELVGATPVPFVLGREDVRKFSGEQGMSIEEAARFLRYRFLFSQAVKVGAQAVVVGHHADDQVETVLMHLLRGSGLAGLRGMQVFQLPNPWSDEIGLLRPLLGFWREDIEAYCRDHGLVPLEDQTNKERKYWRNRIRLDLIPYLETYNPQVKQVLFKLSKTVSADYQWIDSMVKSIWNQCLVESGEHWLVLRSEEFKVQPLAVRRLLIRRSIEKINSSLRNVDYDMVERVVLAINSPPNTRKMDLAFGIRLFWEKDNIWFVSGEGKLPVSDFPQVPSSANAPLLLAIPGVLELAGGWVLTAEVVELGSMHDDTIPFCAWLKLPPETENLNVRCRVPGDRFKPLGLQGHSQKLSDYMIDHKLPARFRAGYPLICLENEILWVPGFTISEFARVREEPGFAEKVVFLQLTRN